MLRTFLNKLRHIAGVPPTLPEDMFSQYEMGMPRHQNAIDALPGWNSAFPGPDQVVAGNVPLFADDRIVAALKAYGPLEGKTVLEVGPLEGMHTYMLNARKPARIDAIEANRQCFLRCLVTKEILGLDRARFYLGNIQPWLEEREEVYDFALASGVLYHMPDPAALIAQLGRRADALFIWTHFFDDAAMPQDDLRRTAFTGRVERREIGGLAVAYHERGYRHANVNASFCGGMKDRHYWMTRADILSLLGHVGYKKVDVLAEEPTHAGGPCFSVFARK